MILRHRLRRSLNARPGSPGRDAGRMTRGSDIILIMMASLLVKFFLATGEGVGRGDPNFGVALGRFALDRDASSQPEGSC